jgi:ubiquinone/menaquinone biosynthesis C-methylase UbiE
MEGDTILDLGSGGGIDVFRASQIVGPKGHAIGVDSTPEMVWRARETSRKYGEKYQNVEFRLGEIEHLPVESDSIDYVISNCVINLSPDKQRVLSEAFRVLRPNGMLAVADITTDAPIPGEMRKTIMDSWSACIGGALSDQEYESLLRKSGFEEIHVEHASGRLGEKDGIGFYSSNIRARKPR